MKYKVVVTLIAKQQLMAMSRYILVEYGDSWAAERVLDQFQEVKRKLSFMAESYAYCEHPALRSFGYRIIHFKNKSRKALFRVAGDAVFIEGIFGPGQDYMERMTDIINYGKGGGEEEWQ